MKNLLLAAVLCVACFGCGEGISLTDPNASVNTNTCSIVQNGSGNVAGCGDVSVTLPSPSPSPSPGSGDCRVDILKGNGPEFVAVGNEAVFGLTPMQTFTDFNGNLQQKEVSAVCNESKAAPVWSSSDTRIMTVVPFGTGFEAKAKRIGTGPVIVTVKFDQREKVFQVQ